MGTSFYLAPPLHLSQHSNEYGSQRPVLRAGPRPDAPDFERAARIGEFWSYPESRALAVDQQLGEGAGSRTERVQALPQLLLQLIRPHGEPETNGVAERGTACGSLWTPSYAPACRV
jgi:hypothetical protein